MKHDQIEINALKFAIMCNFPQFCGEKRAEEAVEIVRELERLAEIGRATEWFYSQGFMITKHRLNTTTALLTIKDAIEWHRAQEVQKE